MFENKIKLLVEVIKRLSKIDNYAIKIESKTERILDSKIGGIPYWFQDKNYPTNSERKKLYIGPSELGRKKVDFPLPKIQFFINNDNFMGINFDD